MTVPLRLGGVLLLAGAAALGCHPAGSTAPDPGPDQPPWFADVSPSAGLAFVHDAGPPPVERHFLPQIIGSGAALFDYDGDGRLDVYLLQNAGPGSAARNRLFHQEPDGSFTDVSAGSGLDVAGWGMGVAVGDVDNDGRPDVLVTEYGGLRLFRNNGRGTFSDVTRQAGLDSLQWGTSACFLDYDRDGWLDLVVVNYVGYDPSAVCRHGGGRPDYCHPKGFARSVARLYHNRGRAAGGVAFEDVTLAAGLGAAAGAGLGVLAADFDGDGWPDILVANDAGPNHLWVNQHNGTFTEEASLRGLAYNGLGQPQGNMGIAAGDVDGSGGLGVFITHLTQETNTLWRQGRRGMFRDVTAAAGLAASRWRGTGFGNAFGDFDNDGALDLAVVNGRVSRAPLPPEAERVAGLDPAWVPYAERNQLFAGDGAGGFRDVSAEQPCFCGGASVARGLAVGDIDNDGGLDLLVTAVGGPARLYRNVAPARGHWLIVRAVDPALRRDAYGAEVVVEAAGRRWKRWLNPGSSYLCSNDPRAHFGLGPVGRVDAIEVLWPDGTAERFRGRAADAVVELRKGEGRGRQ
jgi:enediyne biosynthesis protein E4